MLVTADNFLEWSQLSSSSSMTEQAASFEQRAATLLSIHREQGDAAHRQMPRVLKVSTKFISFDPEP